MDLSYTISGHGTPIIFIHGFSLDSRMWEPQVAHFSPQYQVITYDLRGFGRSPLPDGAYSHIDDLYNLMQELHIQRAHLVGLSLGGEIAIDFALSHPESVISLTLADTSLGGYASTVDWRVYAKEQGIERARQNWLHHAVFAPTNRNADVAAHLKMIVDDYSGWHWLHDDPRIRLDPPAKGRLKEIKVPTQIILGELDLPYYHDIAKLLMVDIPNAKLSIINDAGHMSNFENPVKFNEMLDSFINPKHYEQHKNN